ncbi:MAG: cold shock domain-containing protein [Bacteroidetes bacterium]|nr:cold shock domain-containing protein [Bacteroidota bacterium]
MADSFNKKEREKKRQKRKREKEQKREQRKLEGKKPVEFMYVDEFGNLTETPPDPNLKKKKIKAEDIEISIPKKGKSDQPNFLREGIVKFFNTDKGYGFIVDRATKDSFFVHVDGLVDQIRDNDKVTFEVGKGPKGPIAISVKRI